MKGLLGIIIILILLVNLAIAYLGPDAQRTDFRYLEYTESALSSSQEWTTYTHTVYAPDLEQISKDKQEKREEARRRQALQYELEKDRGNTIGFRDMSGYSAYSFRADNRNFP